MFRIIVTKRGGNRKVGATMIYLICQDWSNTSNNHAGIKYLCNRLQDLHPETYRSFVIPSYMDDRIFSKNRLVRKLQVMYARYQTRIFCRQLMKDLVSVLRPGDTVFLTEYLERLSPMKRLADEISSRCPSVKMWAIVHLIPQKLDQSFPNKAQIVDWLENISLVFTFGHSLSDYLVSIGVDKRKVVTSFHYVDDFYLAPSIRQVSEGVNVIAMGNQARNIELLRCVAEENSDVRFTICQGVVDMSSFFSGCHNVTLVPFVPEADLLSYMKNADISLNVMQDTIGSNVIVTSMAMGLAMVCSDVGSIRDYCDETNTMFCSNDSVKDFSNAIAKLSLNSRLLYDMKRSAWDKAKRFSIENFHCAIKKFVE